MKYVKEIAAQRKVASELAADRKELLGQIPFGSELESTRFDLDRIAVPIVAVTGAYSAGKSALINAATGTRYLPTGVTPTTLVPVLLRRSAREACFMRTAAGFVEEPYSTATFKKLITDKNSTARHVVLDSPKLTAHGWHWLDTPGVNADMQRQAPLRLQARDIADICILATSALQPLTLSDLTQLREVGKIFKGNNLCVALTRIDQLPSGELASVERYVREMLDQALPGRALKVLPVSNGDAASLSALTQHLADVVYHHQKERLKEALEAWQNMIVHLQQLLEMRELLQVKSTTVQRIRTRLDAVILESGALLTTDLPIFMDETCRELKVRLPASQRQLLDTFRARFHQRFAERLQEIGARINRELAEALQQDVSSPISVTLANRFLRLLEPTNPFFDWASATLGGTMGAGAAASAALLSAALPPVGLMLAGAAVIGGLLGGLIGSASLIENGDELKEKIGRPTTLEYQQHLDAAIYSYRTDLQHLCRLIDQVSTIFSKPTAAAYDVQNMLQVLSMAEDRRSKRLVPSYQRIASELLVAEMAERQARFGLQPPPALASNNTPAASVGKRRKKA
ncbi:dynamin family protein [Corallococcus sicarius]|uniref:dynamin family protein n=1 Tax=Corallococcus sicarius TaxID=2316726 RepID=UPI00131531BD|nr:dynamin family protein [Corallococcus sicarius]